MIELKIVLKTKANGIIYFADSQLIIFINYNKK